MLYYGRRGMSSPFILNYIGGLSLLNKFVHFCFWFPVKKLRMLPLKSVFGKFASAVRHGLGRAVAPTSVRLQTFSSIRLHRLSFNHDGGGVFPSLQTRCIFWRTAVSCRKIIPLLWIINMFFTVYDRSWIFPIDINWWWRWWPKKPAQVEIKWAIIVAVTIIVVAAVTVTIVPMMAKIMFVAKMARMIIVVIAAKRIPVTISVKMVTVAIITKMIPRAIAMFICKRRCCDKYNRQNE